MAKQACAVELPDGVASVSVPVTLLDHSLFYMVLHCVLLWVFSIHIISAHRKTFICASKGLSM